MHVCAYSGGKESTMMLDIILRKNMPLDRIVFGDTTLEYDETYEYIHEVEKYYGVRIERLTPETSFDDWFYGITGGDGANKGKMRGYPLICFPCYWCRESKVKPIDALKDSDEFFVYIGYSANEKHRIQKKDNLIYPNIINNIDEKSSEEHLRKIGLVNPIYDKGYSRSGCFLCPKQSKRSLYTLYKNEPKKWEIMKMYEADQGRPFKPGKWLRDYEREFDFHLRQRPLFPSIQCNPYPKQVKQNITGI